MRCMFAVCFVLVFSDDDGSNVNCACSPYSCKMPVQAPSLTHSDVMGRRSSRSASSQVIACRFCGTHYCDVIMCAMAYQITSLGILYSTVHSGTDQRKHQSTASLAFVRGNHRGPENSPHKRPVMWKMFPFDDVITQTIT